MIDFYYWPTPNGWKVSIMLEELGTEYETHYVNIAAGDQFKPDFLAISPNNRMPAIVDRDTGTSVFESGAILWYLARKFDRFLGGDEKSVLEWLFWQTGNLGPMAGQHSHFWNYAPEGEKGGYAAQRYRDQYVHCLGVLERRLDGRDWIVDDYGIADMMSWPWVLIAKAMGVPLDDLPNVSAWRQRVKERPAVQRGVALGKDSQRQRPPTAEERRILFNQK